MAQEIINWNLDTCRAAERYLTDPLAGLFTAAAFTDGDPTKSYPAYVYWERINAAQPKPPMWNINEADASSVAKTMERFHISKIFNQTGPSRYILNPDQLAIRVALAGAGLYLTLEYPEVSLPALLGASLREKVGRPWFTFSTLRRMLLKGGQNVLTSYLCEEGDPETNHLELAENDRRRLAIRDLVRKEVLTFSRADAAYSFVPDAPVDSFRGIVTTIHKIRQSREHRAEMRDHMRRIFRDPQAVGSILLRSKEFAEARKTHTRTQQMA